MTPEKLALALDMLTRPLPPPAQPRPKPQDSFAQLKVGQRLILLAPMYLGTTRCELGSVWEVVSVNSLGAKLRWVQPLNGNKVDLLETTLRDRDWRGKLFARWKKPPKAKGKRK